jgi:UDP-N-acetylglucosamine acyltransferase
VHIDDWVVMGAYAGVHQFCRVGAHAMVAAGRDRAAGRSAVRDGRRAIPATPRGINTEGLKRRGFGADDILAVRRAYKTLYREGPDARRCPQALAGCRRGIAAALGAGGVPLVPGRGIIRAQAS